MASKKHIEANRLNALQSTGPRSPKGKARSSMNALQTGIDAKTQIIRGEIWDTLQELTAEYYGRFRPTTPEKRVLAGPTPKMASFRQIAANPAKPPAPSPIDAETLWRKVNLLTPRRAGIR
jgi:hypothetical protein